MLTVTSGSEKVNIFTSKGEEFETFCFNQFIISFQINDLLQINNSIIDLKFLLERVYMISDMTIEATTVSFYCLANHLNTFKSVLDLESTAIRQVNEINVDLSVVHVPYVIQLIVEGVDL